MKVKYYPWQPHCFAFGGFDMQMINTLEAVKKAGVDADKLDIWSRHNDFEIIHLWGVGPNNYEIIDWAKKAGKKIVATVLSPYYDTTKSRLGYYYRKFFRVRQLTRYYALIDKIVVLNELQLKVLRNYYGVSPSKMEIIPNIVEEKYFEIPSFEFPQKYKIEKYVLCTGNISPRKNQHNLAAACIHLNLTLVLIGNVLDGEERYGKKLEQLISGHKNILWLSELPKASDELTAAYYYCSLFALPSYEETQPISALEAVAMRKPLLLMNRQYAKQEFYKGAILCKSGSIKDIEASLKKSFGVKGNSLENIAILECKENNVGKKYKDCYLNLMK